MYKKEDIENTIKEFFEEKYKPLPEGFDLDNQIKDGYLYQIHSNDGKMSMTVVTGVGGIRDFIKGFRDNGIPDFMFVDEISVLSTDGIRTDTIYHPIRTVVWKEVEKDDSSNNK